MKVKARNDKAKDSEIDDESLEEQKKKIDHSFSERKTQRYKNNKTDLKKHVNEKKPVYGDDHHEHPIEGGIKSRNK